MGVNRDWRSRWYASPQEMPEFLHSDIEIRDYVKKKLLFAAVSKIVIERAWNSIRVTIFTARPGIVIGRKGAEIEKMTEEISKMAQGKQIKIDIQEIKTPELDAQLVAENVALQIERRIVALEQQGRETHAKAQSIDQAARDLLSMFDALLKALTGESTGRAA